MVQILTDQSPPNLVAALENNIFELIYNFRQWPKSEVHDEGSILWSITDIPFPLFNSVMRARLAPEEIDATLEMIVAQGRGRKVPILWWTGPQTSPANLGERLERLGFFCVGEMPGMAVDLKEFKSDLPVPAGFRVEKVEDEASLRLLGQVTCAGFGLPDFVAEPFSDYLSYVDPQMVQVYLGWLADQPVATSLQVLAAGVAGIYNVATIPAARRQGIGAVMTARPLREAQSLGYRAGILFASKMGASIYRSLGFKEYCQISQYVWAPA